MLVSVVLRDGAAEIAAHERKRDDGGRYRQDEQTVTGAHEHPGFAGPLTRLAQSGLSHCTGSTERPSILISRNRAALPEGPRPTRPISPPLMTTSSRFTDMDPRYPYTDSVLSPWSTMTRLPK